MRTDGRPYLLVMNENKGDVIRCASEIHIACRLWIPLMEHVGASTYVITAVQEAVEQYIQDVTVGNIPSKKFSSDDIAKYQNKNRGTCRWTPIAILNLPPSMHSPAHMSSVSGSSSPSPLMSPSMRSTPIRDLHPLSPTRSESQSSSALVDETRMRQLEGKVESLTNSVMELVQALKRPRAE